MFQFLSLHLFLTPSSPLLPIMSSVAPIETGVYRIRALYTTKPESPMSDTPENKFRLVTLANGNDQKVVASVVPKSDPQTQWV